MAASAAGTVFRAEGKMSTFGGPHDTGMSPTEGIALFDKADLTDPRYANLFLSAPPPGTSGLGRRLDPDSYYLACRWDYSQTPRDFLRNNLALVENPQSGRSVYAQPADWGPNVSTGRVADLSPGVAAALGLDTDDDVVITITAGDGSSSGTATLLSGEGDQNDGHGSSNPSSKPEIKEFVLSPNRSSRNGAAITMIVLHCTEASLGSTLAEFQNAGGRQVSAHYVIDRNGDIYQMVEDSDRANHCMGANSNSIGIEHVGGEDDALAPDQATASANLIRWLLAQYDIPRQNVYGHDFAPGYSRPGGTSCPDHLFGDVHSQQTITDWVAQNV